MLCSITAAAFSSQQGLYSSRQHGLRGRKSDRSTRYSLLPHAQLKVEYSTDINGINVDELAHLLCRCGIDHLSTSCADDAYANHHLFTQKLRRALRFSLVCVAAYVSESSLYSNYSIDEPFIQRQPMQSTTSGFGVLEVKNWWLDHVTNNRKVMVGFARAVGDSALVATIHDVAVLPEVRKQGIGTQLVGQLVSHLYNYKDIVDIGTVVPIFDRHGLEEFFTSCEFGDDTEGSVTMVLSELGKQQLQHAPVLRNT